MPNDLFTDAPFDPRELIASFRAYDDDYKSGRGESESSDTGKLGWSEATFVDAYHKLYEVTGQRRWLDKLAAHARRILSTPSDSFGDGDPTWTTATYSVAWLRCEPFHNRGTATIEASDGRVWTIRGGVTVEDGVYFVEIVGRGRYEIRRWPSRERIAAGTFKSSEPIDALAPIRFAITGKALIGDRFRLETFAPQQLEYIVHQGQLFFPLARFAETVRRDRTLHSRYGSIAGQITDFITALAQKHERDWLDTGRGAGGYRFSPSGSERYPNRILPHNQYLAFARVGLVMADLSRRKLFAERTDAMSRNFKRSLRKAGAAWEWHYWDWIEEGTADYSAIEDTSHGGIDIGFAVEACRRGRVFTGKDLRRFARTLLDIMWNGDESTPTFGGRVNTSEGEGHPVKDWIDLAQWDPAVFDLLWTHYDQMGRPANLAPSVLRGWLRRREGLAR